MNKNYLSQHNLIYQKPEKIREQGMAIGNGDMVASFYTPEGSFEWAIGKTDLRDNRTDGYPEKFLSHEKFCELVKNKDLKAIQAVHERENAAYREKTYPAGKPCCFLKIRPAKLDFANSNSFSQVLSLYDAKISLDTERYKVRTYIDATQHKLIVSLIPATAQNIDVELFRHSDPDLGRPEFCFKGNKFFMTYKFPDGFKYVVGVAADHKIDRLSVHHDSVSGQIHAREREKINIILAVATSRECKDPRKKVAQALASMDVSDKGHKKWWAQFWKKSGIEIPDKMIENVYYFGNYFQASAARGNYPIPVQTQWYFEDTNKWHQDYHSNCDIEFSYYSCMPTNHLELFDSYANFFHRILPVVKRQTWATYGWEGAKYPFSISTTGKELAGGTWRYETYVTAWIAQVFWWYYEYSGDIAFLKQKGYEVIREVCIFYQNFLKKDADGRFYSFPCQVVEHNDMFPVKNTTIELAMVKELMQNGIEASKILNKDMKLREKWEEILNNLSAFPNNGKEFLSYEGASIEVSLHHPDVLSPIFPCGHINMDSNKPDLDIARTTLKNIFVRNRERNKYILPFEKIPVWKDNLAYGWITIAAARLGMGKTARDYLLDLIILLELKENGLFTYVGKPENRGKRSMGSADTGTLFVFAVTQMFLQSHDRTIRVFPAIPDDWDMRFYDLRARGAFLVSSEIKKGKVLFVKIKSEAGNRVVLKNPWPERYIKIANGKNTVRKKYKRLICFDTLKNRKYTIFPADGALPQGPKKIIVKPARGPRIVKLPAYLMNPKKKWEICLGKKSMRSI